MFFNLKVLKFILERELFSIVSRSICNWFESFFELIRLCLSSLPLIFFHCSLGFCQFGLVLSHFLLMSLHWCFSTCNMSSMCSNLHLSHVIMNFSYLCLRIISSFESHWLIKSAFTSRSHTLFIDQVISFVSSGLHSWIWILSAIRILFSSSSRTHSWSTSCLRSVSVFVSGITWMYELHSLISNFCSRIWIYWHYWLMKHGHWWLIYSSLLFWTLLLG